MGFVLLAHTVRNAFEDRMRQYRFLQGAHPYKARFASSDPGLETIVVGRPPLPWLTKVGITLARRGP